MASICKFFDEDAVYKINRKKFIDVGLVLENSEYLSSDEELSDEDRYHDWGERMKKGHIRVAWHPNGAEEVLPEKKVRLCDRSLMPGDVVRKIVRGKDTQLGYCRYTMVKSDVQVVGTKQVITGVDSHDLNPLEDFVADIAVFKDSWVGMVKTVKIELTLCCSDGSRCLMSDVDAFDMEDVLDRRERASEFKKYSFYPGQQLWGPSFCFLKVRWLHINKTLEDSLHLPNKSIRSTVEDVKVISLGVQWVCKAYSEENFKNPATEQPKYHVTGDELKKVKMMNIFEPCTLQIGDRNYMVIPESCEVISLQEWKNRMTAHLHASCDPPRTHPRGPARPGTPSQQHRCNGEGAADPEDAEDEGEEEEDEEKSSDASSVTSHSTASSVERDTTSRKKRGPHYATKIKKKVKSVRRRAMRQCMKEAPLVPGQRRVTETLITETKAHVVWQDGTVEHNILSTSLYPVHHLDSHEFFPGDYVVDNKDSRPYEYGVIKSVDHSGRTALVTWLKTYQAGGSPHPEVISEQEVSVYDIKDHPDFKYRPGACVIRVVNSEESNPSSTAGQVVDVHCDGKVEVSWVYGGTSLVYPQELYRVGEYDSDDLWADEDSMSDDDSWETESEKSLLGIDERTLKLIIADYYLSKHHSWLDSLRSVEPPQLPGSPRHAGDSSAERELDGAARDLEKLSVSQRCGGEDEARSTEDMQEKLLANIEKLRAGMARLEEVLAQNPTLQTCNVMRRLLELYKHCKVLDQLLGTTYFHERHLQTLVERLKHRGRVNSIQHMADQIFRLFSSGDAPPDNEEVPPSPCLDTPDSKADIDIFIESPTEQSCPSPFPQAPPLEGEGGGRKSCLLSPVSPTSGSSEPRNLCQQLCSILKSRLLKAHEDAEMRFGMPRSETSALLAAEAEPAAAEAPPTPVAQSPTEELGGTVAKEEVPDVSSTGQGEFSVLESVPDSHKYKLSIFQPVEPSAFFRIVKKEMNLLKSSLPDGIIMKSFEDRIDLYSVLIKGPRRTPYEDGLFFFDFQLPADYPKSPPLCHYVSYCSDRLNPNLYEGGKVCVSLLGTWGGKGTEMWNPQTSNLLQVIVSIQGLILVSEPYYNEAGYERQKGTQQGLENSRMYNEMVVLKLVQSMTNLLVNPPEVFQAEINKHFQSQASKFIGRLERWLEISCNTDSSTVEEMQASKSPDMPEFPLLPASKGFCLTLRKSLVDFKNILDSCVSALPDSSSS